MIFHPVKFYQQEKTSERDELGNELTLTKKFHDTTGRFSTWTSEEIALDSRGVTKTSRKFITSAMRNIASQASYIEIDDTGEATRYKVNDIKGSDFDRWRILYISVYGK